MEKLKIIPFVTHFKNSKCFSIGLTLKPFITGRQEADGLFIWKFYVAMRLCGAKKKVFKFPKNVMESRYFEQKT
jgi:hypothetical protein